MNEATLYAKRIDHNSTEVVVRAEGLQSRNQLVKTTDLLISVARHVPADTFDKFYGSLGTIGASASFTTPSVGEIAAELSVRLLQSPTQHEIRGLTTTGC